MSQFKDYIGDSVYADWDGYHIVLTTENGFGASNTIYLETEVYRCLTEYVKRLDAQITEMRKAQERP